MMRKVFITLAILFLVLPAAAQDRTEPTDSLECQLQEIVVTANNPVTTLRGNTLVSTISGSALQNLGTALDVLSQLPLIKVEDNAVSVQGKGTTEIFIDGRPMREGEELIQLRSDNIRKVELVMAPGAKYASTTDAVIRITTRHNFAEGLSVLERGEVTARRKWSANELLDLNYRHGPWDFFFAGTVARNNSLIKGKTINTLVYDGEKTSVGGSQHNSYPATTGTLKGGLNYTSGPHSFGAYYRFNPEKGDFSNHGTEWLNTESPLQHDITRSISSRSHLVSLYWESLFSEKYLLHFDGDYRNSHTDSDVATTYPSGTVDNVNSADTRNSSLWAGKLYMEFPLLGGEFTVGTQDSYTSTSLDYRMLNQAISSYIPSSLTDVRQVSAAAFASWTRTFGNLDLSAGLRYEYTDFLFKTDGLKDPGLSRTDNLLTPDLSVGYSFSEKARISLSYKTATLRPPYAQLTGSLYYVGRHEIEGGNPTLKDEHFHNFQIFGMYGDFMVQGDFTRSIDTYGSVKRLYPADNLQLLLQPVNMDVSSLDFYLIWGRRIRAWNPEITLGAHKQWLELYGTSYNRPIFSYYFMNTLSLPYEILITVNMSGQTSGDIHTNRFGATWFTMDASVARSFFNKALQLKLSATDIFNTANNDWTMNTCGVFMRKTQTYDRRGISLSLTWRFHPRKSNYKGNSAAESELRRL